MSSTASSPSTPSSPSGPDKVTRWRTSDQKHRCLAAALLDIEPRLRRIMGYRAVPLLRAALHVDIRTKEITVGDQAAYRYD